MAKAGSPSRSGRSWSWSTTPSWISARSLRSSDPAGEPAQSRDLIAAECIDPLPDGALARVGLENGRDGSAGVLEDMSEDHLGRRAHPHARICCADLGNRESYQ